MSAGARATEERTILAVHPGAELFGSDRMFLESVIGLAGRVPVLVALPEEGPLADRIRAAGVTVVTVPMLVLRKSLLRPRGWYTLVRDSLRNLRSARRLIGQHRPAAVYVSTVTLPLWAPLARLHRVRAVTHVHEAESTASAVVRRVLYAPLLATDRIVVNSEFSRRTLLRSYSALAARTEVVLNGVPGPSAPTPLRTQAPDPLRLLFVGRLSPRKGPQVAVAALGILTEEGTNATLDVLGTAFTGYEWFEQELRDQTERLGLVDRVRFLGFESDVWPRLDAADILLVPSIVDEPFGNTAVEGVLAQRPVVASDTSGLREAAGGYASTRLVTPDDPRALADAVAGFCDQWAAVATATGRSAAEADERHHTDRYRSSVARLVTAVHWKTTPGAADGRAALRSGTDRLKGQTR
ncbi:hypothetical protein HMPREF1529_00691 [Microbacterium sp. oral taxon 186 str. F0373]|uniref:glycosyltransferase n=1 Tax=Microbacterium sp. oral taxon 186 TaxID=712383 RepID=UPI00034E1287|nr:glycosyltransferase [Microbacterium sp. oral taxon 186]EPD86088.1 hypothetical protein HMPREF1529_00691 [Microbacterium sp. oral taxon 186 str. F0373]